MNLQAYVFEGADIRILHVNDEVWFVAKDVCDVLCIQNVTQAVEKLDADERSMFNIGRQGNTNFVNEYGLYSLVLRSRKPEARVFKRWITHDVIPTIRRTGKYEAPEMSADVVPMDERNIRVQLLKSALDHEERLVDIEDEIKALSVKVDEQITLDSGEQRRLQKAVSRRVYELEPQALQRPQLYSQLYREIKDRWAVPSYKDVRRTELQEVLRYIEAWKPRVA